MKTNLKRVISLLLICTMICGLTGCSLTGKKYSNYVQGLLDLNYKGDYTYYLKTTTTSKADAEAIYEASMESLADTFINYYGIKIVDEGETKEAFVDIVKEIYSKANYTVEPAQKVGDTYFVEVTVEPMNIIDITYDDVTTYINDFNARIAAGDFDNYEVDQYELEFANGIIDILRTAIPNVTYKEPQTVSAAITTGDYYSISDEDFISISNLLITDREGAETTEAVNPDTEATTVAPTEAQ